jgi:hypothetical protein
VLAVERMVCMERMGMIGGSMDVGMLSSRGIGTQKMKRAGGEVRMWEGRRKVTRKVRKEQQKAEGQGGVVI